MICNPRAFYFYDYNLFIFHTLSPIKRSNTLINMSTIPALHELFSAPRKYLSKHLLNLTRVCDRCMGLFSIYRELRKKTAVELALVQNKERSPNCQSTVVPGKFCKFTLSRGFRALAVLYAPIGQCALGADRTPQARATPNQYGMCLDHCLRECIVQGEDIASLIARKVGGAFPRLWRRRMRDTRYMIRFMKYP